MAIEKVELMHESSPKHLHMRTARLKEDKDTGEEGKERGMKVARSTIGMKKILSA